VKPWFIGNPESNFNTKRSKPTNPEDK